MRMTYRSRECRGGESGRTTGAVTSLKPVDHLIAVLRTSYGTTAGEELISRISELDDILDNIADDVAIALFQKLNK